VAFPPLIVPVPRVVLPVKKVTVPVAAEGETVAVKVTEAPYVEGFNEDAIVVVVFVFAATSSARDTETRTTKIRERIIFSTEPSSVS
jgi:hypothetical protein